MPRIPRDATVDTQRSIRELWQELDSLKRANITDMHGRRLSNTGNPKQRRDYTNKAYVDDLVAKFRREIKQEIGKVARLKTTGGGGGTPPPPPGSTGFSFGYWYVDNLSAPPGANEDQVKGYTNTAFVFDRDGGTSGVPPSDRIANLTAIIDRLSTAGFDLWLDVGPNDFLQPVDMISAAQNHWDKVKYVLCGDEPELGSAAEANVLIEQVKNLIADASLEPRPIGVTLNYDQTVNTNVPSANWDFVNIEAYATGNCPSGNCPDDDEIEEVKNKVTQMKSIIDATKDVHIVMQGYWLNGALTNIPKLAELNAATYWDMAKGDQRVKGINIFAYKRDDNGGSRDFPELLAEHQKIWADLTGGGGGSGGNKKCVGNSDPECDGYLPVCCDGGTSNPCNCPRLCELGQYMQQVKQAETLMIASHQELFVPGTQIFLGFPEATLWRSYCTIEINTSNPTLEAIDDPNDPKQILVRLRITAPEFREDYAVWATDLTPRLPPGAYRATCFPGAFPAGLGA